VLVTRSLVFFALLARSLGLAAILSFHDGEVLATFAGARPRENDGPASRLWRMRGRF
jgi:hypothetical protein